MATVMEYLTCPAVVVVMVIVIVVVIIVPNQLQMSKPILELLLHRV